MAQRTITILEDDIDKSEAAESVSFGLDGVTYSIDLSEANASRLREQLAYWIGHAQRSGGRKAARRGSGAGKRQDLASVRSWARDNGHQVSDRGRISAEIQSAYDAAHA